MNEKTNVVRIFESAKIKFDFHTYSCTGAISGTEVAEAIGRDYSRVFKTLVTVGKSKRNYVFVVPVAKELDLKKAAAAVGEKSIEMLKQKDLLPTTGYVHGGCSPVGMKKYFETVFDKTAEDCPTIVFSAGKIGYQVELPLAELSKILKFKTAPITVE